MSKISPQKGPRKRISRTQNKPFQLDIIDSSSDEGDDIPVLETVKKPSVGLFVEDMVKEVDLQPKTIPKPEMKPVDNIVIAPVIIEKPQEPKTQPEPIIISEKRTEVEKNEPPLTEKKIDIVNPELPIPQTKFWVKREKKLFGIKNPFFYFLKGENTVYAAGHKDTSIGSCYIINTDEYIDRYSSTFVGMLKKHQMGKRFTYYVPTNDKFESNNEEAFGVCFWETKEPRKRGLRLVFPPPDVPHFPSTKEANLSRIAKNKSNPTGYETYDSSDNVESSETFTSIKNIRILSDNSQVIFSLTKYNKDLFCIVVSPPFSPSLCFALSIACILANP